MVFPCFLLFSWVSCSALTLSGLEVGSASSGCLLDLITKGLKAAMDHAASHECYEAFVSSPLVPVVSAYGTQMEPAWPVSFFHHSSGNQRWLPLGGWFADGEKSQATSKRTWDLGLL